MFKKLFLVLPKITLHTSSETYLTHWEHCLTKTCQLSKDHPTFSKQVQPIVNSPSYLSYNNNKSFKLLYFLLFYEWSTCQLKYNLGGKGYTLCF